MKEGDLLSLAGGFLKGLGGGDGNPLKTAEEKRQGYEGMNRDSGMSLLYSHEMMLMMEQLLRC